MKKVSYILIPGLWDQKPLFGWFYYVVARWWTWQGIPTSVCEMRWVGTEPYSNKRERLQKCIEAQSRQGREVVLVGISAGGPMAVIGLKEERAVVAAISISGLLRLNKEDRENPLFAATSWFEAADRGERALNHLSPEKRTRLLTISGLKDDVIDPSKEHAKGAPSVRVKGHSHLPTVVKVLLWYPYTIRRFVSRATSKD